MQIPPTGSSGSVPMLPIDNPKQEAADFNQAFQDDLNKLLDGKGDLNTLTNLLNNFHSLQNVMSFNPNSFTLEQKNTMKALTDMMETLSSSMELPTPPDLNALLTVSQNFNFLLG